MEVVLAGEWSLRSGLRGVLAGERCRYLADRSWASDLSRPGSRLTARRAEHAVATDLLRHHCDAMPSDLRELKVLLEHLVCAATRTHRPSKSPSQEHIGGA